MKTPAIPAQPVQRWLNTHDVAVRLGIKPRTVALWARQGRLPAYRVGRYLRFRWEEIENAMAAKCRVQVAAPQAIEEVA